MPPPFVAYLRVYEPLSSFAKPQRERLRAVLDGGGLDPASVGGHEQTLWLKSQLRRTGPTLPGERADGSPAASAIGDVLVLDPGEIPGDGTGLVAGPLVCPLDIRARAAAALVGFLGTAGPVLRAATVDDSPDRARARATAILGDLPGGAVHVVSTTWTVPLPWFALVDPAARVLESAPRRCYWRVTMREARQRCARAHDLSTAAFGETGPSRVLLDTGRWLANFHEASALELDYGGLVEFLDDDALAEDTSADDVNSILDSLEASDTADITDHFDRLRDFWSPLAARERCN